MKKMSFFSIITLIGLMVAVFPSPSRAQEANEINEIKYAYWTQNISKIFGGKGSDIISGKSPSGQSCQIIFQKNHEGWSIKISNFDMQKKSTFSLWSPATLNNNTSSVVQSQLLINEEISSQTMALKIQDLKRKSWYHLVPKSHFQELLIQKESAHLIKISVKSKTSSLRGRFLGPVVTDQTCQYRYY